MPRWLSLTLTHPVALALLTGWLGAWAYREREGIREAAAWTWAGVCVAGPGTREAGGLDLLAEAAEEALGRIVSRLARPFSRDR